MPTKREPTAAERKRAIVLARQDDVRLRKRERSEALIRRPKQEVEVVVEPKSKRKVVYVMREADVEKEWGLGTGIAIGAGAVLVLGIGVAVVYLLLRRDGTVQALGDAPSHTVREIIREVPYGISGGGAIRAELVMPRRDIQDSHMQTMALPVMGAALAIAIYKGGRDMPNSVTVRVVGVPGAYGVFAYDPVVLDQFSTVALASVPAGLLAIVPAGQTEIIRLKPGQSLYGKANVDGVYASIMAAPTVTAIA